MKKKDLYEAMGRLVLENEELRKQVQSLKDSRDHWKRRALPEGIEWPRFEDGGIVKLGSEVVDCNGNSAEISAVKFSRDGFTLYADTDDAGCGWDERVKRPPLVANDGEPIEAGQVLRGTNGTKWEVVGIDRDRKWSVVGRDGGGNVQALRPEWLSHERVGS